MAKSGNPNRKASHKKILSGRHKSLPMPTSVLRIAKLNKIGALPDGAGEQLRTREFATQATFTQTIIEDVQGKQEYKWTERAGKIPLL